MTGFKTEELHPDLRAKCREFLARCAAAGLAVRVLYTYRSAAEQDKLYAQGRTAPGRRVTNLRGGASKHNATLDGKPAARAFDFGCFTPGGKYVADGSDPLYTKAGEIGESLGLVWGGRWVSPFDPSHLELP